MLKGKYLEARLAVIEIIGRSPSGFSESRIRPYAFNDPVLHESCLHAASGKRKTQGRKQLAKNEMGKRFPFILVAAGFKVHLIIF